MASPVRPEAAAPRTALDVATAIDHPADVAQPGESRHTHFPCFDGLRAIAAGAVLLHHAGFATGFNTSHRFGEFLAHGDSGVAVFFLISGFLLYRPFVGRHLAERPAMSTDRFWWRRALRIFPGYWVALIGIFVLFGFGKGSLSTPGDFFTYFGLTQIYDTTRYFHGVNQAWTLATEISFYAFLPIYALAVRAVARRFPLHKIRVEVLGLVSLVVVCVVWRLAWFTYDPFWHRYGPGQPARTGPAPFASLATQYWLPSHFDLFALGMGLALVSVLVVNHRDRVPSIGRVADWIGAVPWLWWGLAAAVYTLASYGVGLPRNLVTLTGGQFFVRQALYGLTAFLLLLPAVFGDQDRGLVRRFLRWTPVAYFGLVSYGVYLWHQAWLGYVRETWLGQSEFSGSIVTIVVIATACTLVTASLSYYLVERPVLRFKDHPPWRRRAAPA
jgi:peptidoglycan/LPS O-acetylase OafA/YrhL